MHKVAVGVKLLHPDAKLPTYGSDRASGFDFYSTEDVMVFPGKSEAVGTGVAFNIPVGYEIQARGRSGLAFKDDLVAHFGTIDEDYKGEVKVKLWNLGEGPVFLEKGSRIAQGVLAEVTRAALYKVNDIGTSVRGEGGFGSTGMN